MTDTAQSTATAKSTVGTRGEALVTGASTGIGAVYAKRLAKRGYDLVFVARDVARLQAVAKPLRAETGRKVEVLPADLAVSADVARLRHRLAADPAMKLLVNNAGIALNGSSLIIARRVERLIAVNVTAPTHLAAAAGRASPPAGGRHVNMASVLALAPDGINGVYGASKAYVVNLTGRPSPTRSGRPASGCRRCCLAPRARRSGSARARSRRAAAGVVMEAGEIVDAALVGLDRGETVTIPPLADGGALDRLRKVARLALAPRSFAPRRGRPLPPYRCRLIRLPAASDQEEPAMPRFKPSGFAALATLTAIGLAACTPSEISNRPGR